MKWLKKILKELTAPNLYTTKHKYKKYGSGLKNKY